MTEVDVLKECTIEGTTVFLPEIQLERKLYNQVAKRYKNHFATIIANPPFSNRQDIDHILTMYEVCEPGGRIVTLSSPSWIFQNPIQLNFVPYKGKLSIFKVSLTPPLKVT